MEFPIDIWHTVFEYFPSPYKKPLHYDAIMETSSFYFARQRMRNCHSVRRQVDFHPGNSNWESYYERLVTTGSWLRRDIASIEDVLDDFREIFRVYRERNGTNQAYLIQYGGTESASR